MDTIRYIYCKGVGRSRRAMTLLEILVAMAVAATFLSGVIAAFLQIIQVTERTETQVDAVNSARHALYVMTEDISIASIDTTSIAQEFMGEDNPLTYGDGKDNDRDGDVDEEVYNGKDEDGDWQDNHTFFQRDLVERQDWLGEDDLGDFGVDEDVVFDSDSLEFRIFPRMGTERDELVSYEIGTYEGESNVLLRRVEYYQGGVFDREEVSPLAFEVLSLNFLYWDPNRSKPDWRTDWDGSNAGNFNPPGIELPPAVYISLTIYAGTEPFDQYEPGDPVDSITLETAATIEAILHDDRYDGGMGIDALL